MEFDKPAYETGDKVKVLFKAPFNGKLLVTVERNKVLEHHWLTIDNKSAEWSFSVSDAHLPNIYITATLIRALDNTNLPLTVAHGFAPVPVLNEDSKLPVEVVAVASSPIRMGSFTRNGRSKSEVMIYMPCYFLNYPWPQPQAPGAMATTLSVG
jgi:hypothetical protein